jgi:hypothetical protein
MAAYAFPPISLIHRVLQKIAREDCIVVLVAPMWTGQYWFHMLTQLMIDHPILLPQNQDLLRIPGTKARFHEVQKLHLTAWTLSNSVSRQKDFRRRLPIWHRGDAGSPLTGCTLRVYDYTSHGAGVAKSILIQDL